MKQLPMDHLIISINLTYYRKLKEIGNRVVPHRAHRIALLASLEEPTSHKVKVLRNHLTIKHKGLNQ